jgi:hypothetical protein
MKVIERDADDSPKVILARREEMEQAGSSIAGYDIGELLGRDRRCPWDIRVRKAQTPGRVRKVQTRESYTRL